MAAVDHRGNGEEGSGVRKQERAMLEDVVLPAVEYAELQARMTFDPLIRDALAGSAEDRRAHKEAGITGTPSVLTLRLRDAKVALHTLLNGEKASGLTGKTPDPDMDVKCAKCPHSYGDHVPGGCSAIGPSCPCSGFLHPASFPPEVSDE